MTISIIIPTLNEASYILQTIDCTKKASEMDIVKEIIVIDTGSADATVCLLKNKGIKTFSAPELKGKKYAALNMGGRQATGDILLFLDADTLLPQGYDRLILSKVQAGAHGGAFEFGLTQSSFSLYIVTVINRIRYRLDKCYYGDQAIFVRKCVFDRLGGFPKKRIMEAAHFSRQIACEGKMVLLAKKVSTSPRRFIEGGVWSVLLWDTKLWILDLLGFNVDIYSKEYWEKVDR